MYWNRALTRGLSLKEKLEYYSIYIPECECIFWNGCHDKDGYGKLGKNQRPHRIAYELAYGLIPKGLVLDHKCRNRDCINPSHLEAVTNIENIRRGIPYKNPVTHCPKGHEYNAENTHYRKNRNSRDCRACRRVDAKQKTIRRGEG